jgi:hypothetical protein
MRVWLAVVCGLLLAGPVHAQTVIDPATARMEFTESDPTSVTSYQAIVLPTSADAVTGVPALTGPMVPIGGIIISPTAPPSPVTYSVTFAQMGITTTTLPCTAVAPAVCPSYSIVLLAIGPNGISARSISAESDAFALTPLTMPPTAPSTPVKFTIRNAGLTFPSHSAIMDFTIMFHRTLSSSRLSSLQQGYQRSLQLLG